MKYDVFISYSRADIKKVLPIVEDLRVRGISVFFDLSGIESGEEFIGKIVESIDNADMLLFMYTENAIRGQWTKKEVMYAKNQGKRVVPVLLDGSMPSKGWFKFMCGDIDCIDITQSSQKEKLYSNLVERYGSGKSTDEEHGISPIEEEKSRTDIVKMLRFKLGSKSVKMGLLLFLFFVICCLSYRMINKSSLDQEDVVSFENVNPTSSSDTQVESSQVSKTFIDNGIRFKFKGVSFDMVKVEGGGFRMGSDDDEAFDDEKSIHTDSVSTFYVGKTEVTQALWVAVMDTNPSNFKGDKLPVECVSWNDCQTFIRKLDSITGENFRLPTETEWEYAARGGNKSRGYKYSGSSKIDEVAWYNSNSGSKTHPVATKSSNELGLYDMSGNVWEWTSDRYNKDYSSSRTGLNRVCRGGSWYYVASRCRVSCRYFRDPSYLDGIIGLRLALSQSAIKDKKGKNN